MFIAQYSLYISKGFHCVYMYYVTVSQQKVSFKLNISVCWIFLGNCIVSVSPYFAKLEIEIIIGRYEMYYS